MFFRKKKREEAIKEIKDLVEGRKVPEEVKETEEKEVLEEKEETPKEEVEKKTEEVAEEKREKKVEEKKEEVVPERRPAFAPLFVKLERYRAVLDTINDLKTALLMVKNALNIQRQIEGLKEENRRFLEAAVRKIDKKIASLDAEFLRPAGFEEEYPPVTYEPSGLEGVVEDLKKQIESLKSELKTIT
ncbi:MAG TPA: hypothetical protein ENG34_00055 [Candidatus Aenigmarchaeota archaeon]|nr:hypothetical protein [Candidatus Aenigmarchaeota archaeon]